jgi:hypothetical protein
MKPLRSLTIRYSRKWLKARIKKVKGSLRTKCWVWQNSVDKFGYGQILIVETGGRKRRFTAHRYFFMLDKCAEELPSDIVVRHQCANPACCRPKHMLKGSHTDNYWDSRKEHIRASKQLRGVRARNATLTDGQVRKMRKDFKKGRVRIKDIVAKTGLNRNTVRSMLVGATYANVK